MEEFLKKSLKIFEKLLDEFLKKKYREDCWHSHGKILISKKVSGVILKKNLLKVFEKPIVDFLQEFITKKLEEFLYLEYPEVKVFFIRKSSRHSSSLYTGNTKASSKCNGKILWEISKGVYAVVFEGDLEWNS